MKTRFHPKTGHQLEFFFRFTADQQWPREYRAHLALSGRILRFRGQANQPMNPSPIFRADSDARRHFRFNQDRRSTPAQAPCPCAGAVLSCPQPAHLCYCPPDKAVVQPTSGRDPGDRADHSRQSSRSIKTIAVLLASAAALGAVVATAGFALDLAVYFSIGATAGIVGLHAYDYRRIRQSRAPERERRS